VTALTALGESDASATPLVSLTVPSMLSPN
jgi:hypothetical protein